MRSSDALPPENSSLPQLTGKYNKIIRTRDSLRVRIFSVFVLMVVRSGACPRVPHTSPGATQPLASSVRPEFLTLRRCVCSVPLRYLQYNLHAYIKQYFLWLFGVFSTLQVAYGTLVLYNKTKREGSYETVFRLAARHQNQWGEEK